MRLQPVLVAALAGALGAGQAHAGGALLAGGSDTPLVDDTNEVVVMRKGTRTVVTIVPSYRGPGDPFAVVIPVPASVQERDVKVVRPELVRAVDRLGAPRLVELWEQDPCAKPVPPAAPDDRAPADDGARASEYRLAIVAAKDVAALDAALRRDKLQLPPGADALVEPYLARGMKLLVATVDPGKLELTGERTRLSPLRFHFDSDTLALPIRVGLANSTGTQDLTVHVLAPKQRYAAATAPNITIATNLDVTRDVRGALPAFYAALFDATVAHQPGTVVTEYAWDATACEPCTGPTLGYADLQALGADVLDGPLAAPTPYGSSDFVLTRLHLRHDKAIASDLELAPAPPIAGGRERLAPDGERESSAQAAQVNAFQARYAIRHPWLGPITCTTPVRGRWAARGAAEPALDIAAAPRDAVQLAAAVVTPVPALGLGVVDTVPPPNKLVRAAPREGGCAISGPGDAGGVLVVLLFVLRRSKRRRVM